MSEVKGCPCCSAAANVDLTSDTFQREVYCSGCQLSVRRDTEAEAIAAWNRRQPISEEALAEFMATTIYKMSWSSLPESAKNAWRKDAQAIIAHLTGKAGT